MQLNIKKFLADQIQMHHDAILQWQSQCIQKAPPPFYCSIDLRDSGHKIVPVDCNLYPAGFNNLCPEDLRTASDLFQLQIPEGSKVLILPETHTQNKYYIENIYYLSQMIQNAGYEVQVGWLAEGKDPVLLEAPSGKKVTAYPVQIREGVLSALNFSPDFILLNHDFSAGYPSFLETIKQPILPSYLLGWHRRKKSEHFQYYNQLAKEFASIIQVDPWYLQIDTEEVAPVNFNEQEGTEAVAQVVEQMLARTRCAYEHRKIEGKPFVFIKHNAGTYGRGIMVAHSSDELRSMNRRTKTKMSMGKNHVPIRSVVVQEGVPTATLVDRLAAEPVIYLLGAELMGGFLRTHPQRGVEENLNSQGMVFKKLCMSDLRFPQTEHLPDDFYQFEKQPILEIVYGAIAKLSAFATGLELANHSFL